MTRKSCTSPVSWKVVLTKDKLVWPRKKRAFRRRLNRQPGTWGPVKVFTFHLYFEKEPPALSWAWTIGNRAVTELCTGTAGYGFHRTGKQPLPEMWAHSCQKTCSPLEHQQSEPSLFYTQSLPFSNCPMRHSEYHQMKKKPAFFK